MLWNLTAGKHSRLRNCREWVLLYSCILKVTTCRVKRKRKKRTDYIITAQRNLGEKMDDQNLEQLSGNKTMIVILWTVALKTVYQWQSFDEVTKGQMRHGGIVGRLTVYKLWYVSCCPLSCSTNPQGRYLKGELCRENTRVFECSCIHWKGGNRQAPRGKAMAATFQACCLLISYCKIHSSTLLPLCSMGLLCR